MTKIIDLLEVNDFDSDTRAIYCSKETFNESDLLIAQDMDKEEWYNIYDIKTPFYLKTGYTMYILTKHIK